MTDLTLPIFTDPEKAREHMETIRWPNGPVCPHCGTVGEATLVKGKSHRPGLYQCNACREAFTVTVGTVMEKSHIPLNKWVLGFHLMAASKKGISAHQLHRMLGVTYKSAWFMAHRIREAMAPAVNAGPVGGAGMIVESDETEISQSHKTKNRRDRARNMKFMTLVERDGHVRSRNITGVRVSMTQEVRDVLKAHLHPESVLHTDSASWYESASRHAKGHERVNHSYEYVGRAKDGSAVHVNSAEGFFSIFKRGLVGTYQHMSEQHLQRYLNEFDFRMSYRIKTGYDDEKRAVKALKGAEGKRLTYYEVAG